MQKRRTHTNYVPMSCMAVSIHERFGRPMGLGWPGVECSSCLSMVSLGLRAACPSHLTVTGGGHQLSNGGVVWAVVGAQHLPKPNACIMEGLQLCPLCLCEAHDSSAAGLQQFSGLQGSNSSRSMRRA